MFTSQSSGHHIIVVGGSAGGREALKILIGYLPKEFSGSLFIVLHTHEHAPRSYAKLFSDAGPLPVSYPTHDQPIQSGHIYLAPPNQHLLLKADRMLLSFGPLENRSRPAIDPLFRSAAVAHGAHVVGVVLTGLLDDGAAGLYAIKRCGGFTMVQDPEEATYPDMPRAALERTDVDFVGNLHQLAEQLARLTTIAPQRHVEIPEDLEVEVKMTELVMSHIDTMKEFGAQVPISCPSCAGPLWRKGNDEHERYRCHMGHAFSARSLLIDQDEAVEKALWSAAKILEERARLLQNMAKEAKAHDRHKSAEEWTKNARKVMEEAKAIHAVIRDIIRGHARDEADPYNDPIFSDTLM